jgi:hypothetical protein
MMKLLTCAMLLSAFSHPCFAQASSDRSRQAVEACLAQCASSDASCRRVCPVTFSGPCLTSCDARGQACRQSCERR